MPTYIALIDFTPKGFENIQQSPQRAEQFASRIASSGVTIKSTYWTSGGHDGLLVLEAPDDSTASAALLSLSRAGNVRTQTMRAFDATEMKELLAKMD